MMRKISVLFSSALLMLVAPLSRPGSAAEFDTGFIRILLNNYGRVQLALSAPDSTLEIDRLSILVGINQTAVFDYLEDAAMVEPAQTVAAPSNSDLELRGVVDNGNSGEPPAVLVRYRLLGWVAGGYTLLKCTIVNSASDTITAHIGMEILPQINGLYGDETIEWLADEEVVSIHKPDDFIGLKWLSDPLISLKSFDWYEGYNASDDNLWNWLNYNQFDALLQAGSDGSVAIPAQDSVIITGGDSTAVWLALAYGARLTEMLDNLDQAVDAYNALAVKIHKKSAIPLPTITSLAFPNPFNAWSMIRFSLPHRQQVLLQIFDSEGHPLTTLVDDRLDPGTYEEAFEAESLPSGVYFYRLRIGKVEKTNKIVLIK